MRVCKLAGVACVGLWEHSDQAADWSKSDKSLVKWKRLGSRGVEGDTPVDVS